MSLIVTFVTVHQALKCESALGADGMSVRVMPVPRRLSSSCGLCAEVTDVEGARLCGLLGEHGIEYEAVYSMKAGCAPELVAAAPNDESRG